MLAPVGPVYQAGTLSGNPLATAAGLAVLDLLDDAAYARWPGRAGRAGGRPGRRSSPRPACRCRCPSSARWSACSSPTTPVTDYDAAKAAPTAAATPASSTHMLDRGVALAPSPFEALFPSLAHTKDDLERTADLAAAAARATA